MSPQRFVERSSVSSSGGAFRRAFRVERRGSASRGVACRREEGRVPALRVHPTL